MFSSKDMKLSQFVIQCLTLDIKNNNVKMLSDVKS